MSAGFRQPTPERREADRVALATEAGGEGALDFCNGCGNYFRPSYLNKDGACTRCCDVFNVYQIRYGA